MSTEEKTHRKVWIALGLALVILGYCSGDALLDAAENQKARADSIAGVAEVIRDSLSAAESRARIAEGRVTVAEAQAEQTRRVAEQARAEARAAERRASAAVQVATISAERAEERVREQLAAVGAPTIHLDSMATRNERARAGMQAQLEAVRAERDAEREEKLSLLVLNSRLRQQVAAEVAAKEQALALNAQLHAQVASLETAYELARSAASPSFIRNLKSNWELVALGSGIGYLLNEALQGDKERSYLPG